MSIFPFLLRVALSRMATRTFIYVHVMQHWFFSFIRGKQTIC